MRRTGRVRDRQLKRWTSSTATNRFTAAVRASARSEPMPCSQENTHQLPATSRAETSSTRTTGVPARSRGGPPCVRRRGGRPRWGRPAAPPPPGRGRAAGRSPWAARPRGRRGRGARPEPVSRGTATSHPGGRQRRLRPVRTSTVTPPRSRGQGRTSPAAGMHGPAAGGAADPAPCAGGGGLAPVGGSTAGAEGGGNAPGAHTGMRAGPRADRDSPRAGGLCARCAARRTRDAPPGRSPRTGRPSLATPLHGLGDPPRPG